jgi:hypothetical protein
MGWGRVFWTRNLRRFRYAFQTDDVSGAPLHDILISSDGDQLLFSNLRCCLCFAGNVFVIAAILLERNLQNVANYLIVSLAVADLMVACLVMPLGAVYEVSCVSLEYLKLLINLCIGYLSAVIVLIILIGKIPRRSHWY